jgi:hypothetical protein
MGEREFRDAISDPSSGRETGGDHRHVTRGAFGLVSGKLVVLSGEFEDVHR